MLMQSGVRRPGAIGQEALSDVALAQLGDELLPDALALARTQQEARDLLCDALSRIYERQHQLRDPSKLTAWARTILRRTFIDQRRVFSRHPTVTLDLVQLSAPQPDERLVDLRRAVQTLSRADQVLIYLHYALGYSIQETAVELSIPAGTAKSRLHAALAELRWRLGKDGR